MERNKRERLEKAGWNIGTPKDFLGLSEEEARYIELKFALSEGLRAQRNNAGLSQEELARRIGSSQSRVSKMEKSDPSVSVDLLVRSMLAAGATRRDVAAAIRSKHPTRKKIAL